MLISFYNNNTYPSKFTGGCCIAYKGGFPLKMKEDFFAKSRNGHLLKDTFNRTTNTLDIYSSGLYPANVLSNLAPKKFCFDGIECASIEGFLQSLKFKDRTKQREVCKLYGGSAKDSSKKATEWLKTHKLYWQGKEYHRFSQHYHRLLIRAYKACYEQNELFRQALNSTKGMILTHSSGKTEPATTVLTQNEFISILTGLRDKKI